MGIMDCETRALTDMSWFHHKFARASNLANYTSEGLADGNIANFC